MASELAESIAKRFGANAQAVKAIDVELAPVREVLEGLYNGNNDCWCSDSEQEPHSAACLAAQALMEQLKNTQ
jgi:hypothetical protein